MLENPHDLLTKRTMLLLRMPFKHLVELIVYVTNL